VTCRPSIPIRGGRSPATVFRRPKVKHLVDPIFNKIILTYILFTGTNYHRLCECQRCVAGLREDLIVFLRCEGESFRCASAPIIRSLFKFIHEQVCATGDDDCVSTRPSPQHCAIEALLARSSVADDRRRRETTGRGVAGRDGKPSIFQGRPSALAICQGAGAGLGSLRFDVRHVPRFCRLPGISPSA